MFLAVMMLIILLGAGSAQKANVTFFKQTPPPGHVVAGDVVTIQCEATANSVYWRANLSRIYSSSEVFHVSTSVGSDVWNTTLSTNATVGINNTKITCHASGSSLQQADKKFTYIILANRPLTPPASLEVIANGSVLHMWWSEPYSYANFPITSYNVSVYNETTDNLLLGTSLNSTQFYYDYEKQEKFNVPCQKLIFAVAAVNDIGISDSALEEGMFPIFPESYSIEITYDVLFMPDGAPRLTVQFQEIMPGVLACSLQSLHYTLDILNYNGLSVASSGTKLARPTHGNIYIEQFTSGIRQNNTYSVRLIFTHSQLSGQVILTKDGVVVPILQRPTISSSPETMAITVVAVGMTVLVVCVVLTVSVALSCIRKKGRRPVIRVHVEPSPNTDTAHEEEFQLDAPPKSRTKGSKTLPVMSVNPIYDGPTYDILGGESFKLLLGNRSVPSTPISEECHRYLDMLNPPSLPPPRKMTAVSNGSITPCTDMCTGMKPISSRYMPGSCVSSCSPALQPPTFQESMGGDYVLCHRQVNSTSI